MPSYGTDFLVLHVSTSNFEDNLLTFAALCIMPCISTTRCATAHVHIYLFTFSIIRSIKYCIGPKNRSRDFDENTRFEAC